MQNEREKLVEYIKELQDGINKMIELLNDAQSRIMELDMDDGK